MEVFVFVVMFQCHLLWFGVILTAYLNVSCFQEECHVLFEWTKTSWILSHLVTLVTQRVRYFGPLRQTDHRPCKWEGDRLETWTDVTNHIFATTYWWTRNVYCFFFKPTFRLFIFSFCIAGFINSNFMDCKFKHSSDTVSIMDYLLDTFVK